MKSKALALFLTLSVPSFAMAQDIPALETTEDVRAVQVESGLFLTPSHQEMHVKSGCYLSETACVSKAAELAGLRAENAQLKKAPAPSPLMVVGLVVLAAVVGGGAGYAVGKLAR